MEGLLIHHENNSSVITCEASFINPFYADIVTNPFPIHDTGPIVPEHSKLITYTNKYNLIKEYKGS